jgi:chloramphenicol-sensitive protein RarD
MLQKIALGFAGLAVAVLTISYGRPPFLALAIASTWTIYGLLKKQVPLRPVDSLTAETMVLFVPAAGLVAWSFSRDTGIPSTATTGQLVLVLLTGLITAVPLLFFAHAALRLPLTLMGPLQYLVPVINFLLGWLAYGEPLEAARLVGFLLVWCGLALSLVDTLRSRATFTPAKKSG